MYQNSWNAVGEQLSTASLADACFRLNATFQLAPIEIRPVVAGMWCCGRAHPVRHHGSVDVFLAALDEIQAGEILVIDNDGRTDEGCIGDLIALEAAAGGVGGVVVWGCHRDTPRLVAIDLPVFSLGACPTGPRRPSAAAVDQSQKVTVGSAVVNPGDVVVADDDGVLVISSEQFARVLPVVREIQHTEQAQADGLGNGKTLREQLRFDAYLALRCTNPNYTFRDHVRQMNGAIEV